MASHRMLLTLNDELHEIFKELSEVTGTPAATLAVQLLDSSKDQLKETIKAVRLAKQGQSKAALMKMKKMVAELAQDFDETKSTLGNEIEKQ